MRLPSRFGTLSFALQASPRKLGGVVPIRPLSIISIDLYKRYLTYSIGFWEFTNGSKGLGIYTPALAVQ